MGSIIWCARAQYAVEDSRSDIAQAITAVRLAKKECTCVPGVSGCGDCPPEPPGFIFVTRLGTSEVTIVGQQVMLSIDHISSVEALPGSGV